MATTLSKPADNTSAARKAQIAAMPSDVLVIGNNFSLPLGVHEFKVAESDAFGILNIEGTKGDNKGKKFALPIIAGTVVTNEGITHTVLNTMLQGAKTLVFPAEYYQEMQHSGDYDITVEERNGRKVITAINAVEIQAEIAAPVKAGRAK